MAWAATPTTSTKKEALKSGVESPQRNIGLIVGPEVFIELIMITVVVVVVLWSRYAARRGDAW